MTTKKNTFLSADSLYTNIFRKLLAKDEGVDAEKLSEIALNILGQTSLKRHWPGFSKIIDLLCDQIEIDDPRLNQNLFGCNLRNPIGLAAGFDKNGVAAGIWDRFGFGFAELGTVTLHAQPGNQRPRLFRLAKEKAALNRMGFNNNGAEEMLICIKKQSLKKRGQRPCLIGINLGKSKKTPLKEFSKDYSSSLKLLADQADYAVINISSPNTPGLRELQNSRDLTELIETLREIPGCPPLFVKIAPDLDNDSIMELASVALKENLSGIIAVNTSINRFGLADRKLLSSGLTLAEEQGGLSGLPLQGRALEIIRLLHSQTDNKLKLIGVGGIDSPQSAWERISAGASLIQVYTGWIFQGPGLIPKILEGLITQIDRHGFKNIAEAVGSEAPWI